MGDGERTRAGRVVPETTEPVDAATVILLRDRSTPARGFEVLLLERHLESDFAGGALVFPGGKVDEGDGALDAARWVGRPPASWTGILGVAEPRRALGLLVAAVRETFEEAGVLLARREDGAAVSVDELASPSFVAARARLARRGTAWDWASWLEDEELVLDLGSLALWSWWTTPRGQHRRFDTRFFVARLPDGQVARDDGVETSSPRWLTPAEALAAGARGEATVIFPTRRNLEAFAAHPSAAAVWQAAADGATDQRRIEPRLLRVGGRLMVQHPDEDDPEPV